MAETARVSSHAHSRLVSEFLWLAAPRRGVVRLSPDGETLRDESTHSASGSRRPRAAASQVRIRCALFG
jgi:hypothetical protein